MLRRIFVFDTLREGWVLLYLLLDRKVSEINFLKNVATKTDNDKRIASLHVQLIGSIYIIIRRMKEEGHTEDAAKMQEILDMVEILDVKQSKDFGEIVDRLREIIPPGTLNLAAAMLIFGTYDPTKI